MPGIKMHNYGNGQTVRLPRRHGGGNGVVRGMRKGKLRVEREDNAKIVEVHPADVGVKDSQTKFTSNEAE